MIDTTHLTDIHVLACTLYGTARSEQTEGILAVACMIRNRVKAGGTYRGICLSDEFECWSPDGGEGNHAKLSKLVADLKVGPVTDHRYRECAWIATGVVNEWGRDITDGADAYHRAGLTPRPDWARPKAPIKQVAKFVFYRLTGKAA